MAVTVTIGLDVPAYMSFELNDESSKKQWIEAAEKALEGSCFEPDWEWSDNPRIVIVTKDGECLAENISLAPAQQALDETWKAISETLPPEDMPILVGWKTGLSPGDIAWDMYYNAVIYDSASKKYLEYLSLSLLDWDEHERPTHWRHFPRFDGNRK